MMETAETSQRVVIRKAIFPSWSFALYGLMMTAPWEGILYATVAGINFRPYELFLGLLLLIVLAKARLRFDTTNVILLLYVLSGVPSLLNSPSKSDTIVILFFEFVMVLIAIAVRSSITTREKAEKTLIIWGLVISNIVNAYGWLQILSWFVRYPISPQFHQGVYPVYRPYSSFIEPNFYGNFLASQIAMLVVLWLSQEFKALSRPIGLSVVSAAVLLAFNQSRGPWLGTLFAIGQVFLFRYLWKGKIPTRLVLGVVAVIILALYGFLMILVVSPDLGAQLIRRVEVTINPLQEGAALDRVSDIRRSLDLFYEQPLIGNGVGTWGYYLQNTPELGRDARTPPRNIFISWLFEKGLVGGLAGLVLLATILRRTRRGLRTQDGTLNTIIWACFAGWLAVFFTFQFTRLDISPFYWVVIGLLLGATDVSRRMQPQAATLARPVR